MSIDAESLNHEKTMEELLKCIYEELVRLNAQHEFITNEVVEDYDIEDRLNDHN